MLVKMFSFVSSLDSSVIIVIIIGVVVGVIFIIAGVIMYRKKCKNVQTEDIEMTSGVHNYDFSQISSDSSETVFVKPATVVKSSLKQE